LNATSPIRPAPYHAERAITFKAWRNDRPAETPADATSIEEVAQALAATSPRGTVLTIHMIDAGRNKQTVAFYTVRASSKRYSWRPAYDGGRPVKVPALEPHLLHCLDVHAFAPVEAFDALRDDAVGRDLSLVSQ
jgi:hypothetical protein